MITPMKHVIHANASKVNRNQAVVSQQRRSLTRVESGIGRGEGALLGSVDGI